MHVELENFTISIFNKYFYISEMVQEYSYYGRLIWTEIISDLLNGDNAADHEYAVKGKTSATYNRKRYSLQALDQR